MTEPTTYDPLALPPPDVIPYDVAAQAIRYLDHVRVVAGRRYVHDQHTRIAVQTAARAVAAALVPTLNGRLAIGDDPPLDQPLPDVVAQVRAMLTAVEPTGTGVHLLHLLTLVNQLRDCLELADEAGAT